MKAGIIGYGVIGKATHKTVLNHYDVAIHDIQYETDISVVYDSEVVFICITTVTNEDIDTLTDIINKLKQNSKCRIVIRSTVPFGFFNDHPEVNYCPEFVRDRSAEEDSKNLSLFIGGPSLDLKTDRQIVESDCATLELVKMFTNNIRSMMVVFANHFYDLAQHAGVDYDKVVEYYEKTDFFDQNYLECNKELRAFGGKCLPKDLNYLIDTFKKLNLDQTLFNAIKEDNKKWPVTVRKS